MCFGCLDFSFKKAADRRTYQSINKVYMINFILSRPDINKKPRAIRGGNKTFGINENLTKS